jgi:NAD(P)-dependent dehydrogenase (short-subunit alcohol dehydrogenase family)
VVITGGAKGIGLATLHAFAALGDRTIALGRDHEALQAVGGIVCDVTDEDVVTNTFKEIGDVDVLVNNAGMGESAPLAKTTLDSWHRHLEVNATAAFLCMRAVIPGMRDRNRGAVVNVASTAGRQGVPYTSAYTASKHALVGLTRAVAAELAGTGVRVNAVCPTFVRTEMTSRSIANIVERTGRSQQDSEQALADAAPLGRLLEPEEVAEAIVYLASDSARAVNGQALIIDGGGVQT